MLFSAAVVVGPVVLRHGRCRWLRCLLLLRLLLLLVPCTVPPPPSSDVAHGVKDAVELSEKLPAGAAPVAVAAAPVMLLRLRIFVLAACVVRLWQPQTKADGPAAGS